MIGACGKTYSNFKLRLGLNDGSVLCKLDHPIGVSPRPCRKMSAAGDDGDDEQEEAVDAEFAVALAILLKTVTDAALLICVIRRMLLSRRRVHRERGKPIMRNSKVLTTPLDL
jgi:hypothetical protein